MILINIKSVYSYLFILSILFIYALKTKNKALRNFLYFFSMPRNEFIFITYAWVSMRKRVSHNDVSMETN